MFGRKSGLPPGWESVGARYWAQWSWFSADERARLAATADWLLRKKSWEAAVGFEGFAVTDEMRTLIALQAAVLVLGLDDRAFGAVEAIVVWPSTISIHRTQPTGLGLIVEEGAQPVLGEAHDLHGPILLAWDAVLSGAANPERGTNVVFHEFAHKIDMIDGETNGAPGFRRPEDEDHWYSVCDPLLDALAAGEARVPLDPYGGTNEAEFFAVATEVFFSVPGALAVHEPELYALFRDLYNQDPARR
jgi:hypothetical protein